MSKNVFIIVGGTGVGKTEILSNMIKKNMLSKAITMTTREPREGEINGKDYFFTNKEDLFDLYSRGELMEPPAEFSGNFYAVPKKSLQNLENDIGLIIEYKGLIEISKKLKESDIPFKTIFVKTTNNKLFENALTLRASNKKTIDARKLELENEKTWENFNYDLIIENNYIESIEDRKEHVDMLCQKIIDLKRKQTPKITR